MGPKPSSMRGLHGRCVHTQAGAAAGVEGPGYWGNPPQVPACLVHCPGGRSYRAVCWITGPSSSRPAASGGDDEACSTAAALESGALRLLALAAAAPELPGQQPQGAVAQRGDALVELRLRLGGGWAGSADGGGVLPAAASAEEVAVVRAPGAVLRIVPHLAGGTGGALVQLAGGALLHYSPGGALTQLGPRVSFPEPCPWVWPLAVGASGGEAWGARGAPASASAPPPAVGLSAQVTQGWAWALRLTASIVIPLLVYPYELRAGLDRLAGARMPRRPQGGSARTLRRAPRFLASVGQCSTLVHTHTDARVTHSLRRTSPPPPLHPLPSTCSPPAHQSSG